MSHGKGPFLYHWTDFVRHTHVFSVDHTRIHITQILLCNLSSVSFNQKIYMSVAGLDSDHLRYKALPLAEEGVLSYESKGLRY